MKWHRNLTPWEVAENIAGAPHLTLMQALDRVDAFKALNDRYAAAEYVRYICVNEEFKKLGRPTWLVSNEVLAVAKSLDTSDEDCQFSLEHLPYNAFMFAFEKNNEIMSVICANGKCLENNDVSAVDLNGTVMLARHSKSDMAEISKRKAESAKLMFWVHTTDNKQSSMVWGDTSADLFAVENEAFKAEIVRVVINLIMLWRARPFFVKPVVLPRSDRYNFKGDRTTIREWVLPLELIQRTNDAGSISNGKWTVRPHWRAGHFRHYRHERYARMPDGSVRIEFIEACFVGDPKV